MNYLHRLVVGALGAFFIASSALAQNAGTVTNHAFVIGKGAGTTGYTSLLCASAQLAVGQSAADPICRTLSGDATLSAAGALTLATVNSNVGSFGSTTQCVAFTVNAKGLVTAASAATCAPAVGSITGLGTGIATWLATPSSANLRAALTDESGTGAAYFQGGDLGTPSAGVMTNATALNATQLTTGTVPAARMPALTGACTTSAGAVATSCQINTTINGGGATNTIVAGATGWVGIGLICNSTEAFCYLPQPQAGTISNFYLNVNLAPGGGQTYTVTMRKNASNQTVTCTISGGAATGCNDTTHSFTVAAADNVSVQITASAGAATVSVANFGFKLVTTSP